MWTKDFTDIKAEQPEEGHQDISEFSDITAEQPKKEELIRSKTKTDQEYHKLKVPDLRDMVIQQNILTEREAKTTKKQELVNLLKKNN